MIRWITDQIGTAAASDPSISSDMNMLDVRNLVDKKGNSTAVIKEKIEQGLKLLAQGKKLVVCCDYGISRSNAIAAGILARFHQVTFEHAIKDVINATGEHEIKLEMISSVRAALNDKETDNTDFALRILITGGSGFVGQNLAAKLAGSYFVMTTSQQEIDLLEGAAELDLLVKKYKINVLIHLANPRVYTSSRALGNMLTMLRNAIDVCVENDIRLIYPSSWEVYSGYKSKEFVADHHSPLLAKGPYGEAKLLCENLIGIFRNSSALKCALVRSATLYGEGAEKPKFINSFIKKAINNEAIVTHKFMNGFPCIDLLHIDDFISAIISMIEAGFTGDINIGSGRLVSTREIAEFIVKKTGTGYVAESENINDYGSNILFDISNACNVLNWEPFVNWETGLGRLIEIKKTGNN